MDRFILRFTGKGTASDSDLKRIRSAAGVTILEDASPRMLLVETSPEVLDQLIESLPGWISARERMVPLPDPRPKVRRS